MLKELCKYENLGTPGYHFHLLRIFRDNPEGWRVSNVFDLFRNRLIDNRRLFDGCLPLLECVGIIEINSSEEITPDSTFFKYLESEGLMIDRLVERLMVALNVDVAFHNIFCSEFISYDIVYRSIQIDNSAFPLKYSCFKQLLIDFSVLQQHPSQNLNKYIINNRFKKIFDKVVLPEIKRRKIGIEDLQKSLEQNQLNGEEAEKFVLKFENDRFNGAKEINWVAEYSVSDGYDIASFETENSDIHDRFIEVKSYSGEPYFFWSRNEMDAARIKKLNYYLYLVDRNKMGLPNYIPIIIQDPYNNVLKNTTQWEQRIEKIRFQKNKDYD